MLSSYRKKKRMNKSSPHSTPATNTIDNLPDEVLCHILSFLPTKQAATTSILSKRWKLVWLLFHGLNFDNENFKDFNSFREFVYSTMFTLRDKKLPIHSFNFKCGKSSRFTQKQYDRILKIVMQNKVVNLNFDLSNKIRITKLPPRIFSLKLLQVLKVTNIKVGDFDKVDFPHLKTLHFNSVHFTSQEHVVKFLLGCPILENLQSGLYSGRKDNIIENLNALPNLVKVRLFDSNTPMALLCKTEILHMEKVLWTNWRNLPMFQNLTHLNIRILNLDGMKISFQHDPNGEYTPLLGILPHVPKLQHFDVQDCWNDYWNDPPVVSECLSLQLKTFCIGGYKGSKYEFGLAKYILQHSKVLETMTIKSAYTLSKHQMRLKLPSCIRGSTTCKLLFD